MVMVMVMVVVVVPAPPPPTVVVMVVMVNYYHLSHLCSIGAREPRVVSLQGRQSIWHGLKEVAVGGRSHGLRYCRRGGLYARYGRDGCCRSDQTGDLLIHEFLL